jgi:GNAT superfamily N-acetyltransferase
VRIEGIAEQPGLVETVARWQSGEWGHLGPDESLAVRIASLREQAAHPGRIPITFVALDGDAAVGCASIEDGMSPPTPRLVRLYVPPEARGRRVGSALVRRVMEETAALGIPRLYLFTQDARGLYEKRGWHVIESKQIEGRNITIMAVDLVPAHEHADARPSLISS